MLITKDDNTSQYQIRSYAPGKVVINETTYTRSIIVSHNTLVDDWPPQTVNELTHDHLQGIVSKKPRIVIIGTGAKHIQVDPKKLAPLINQNIGVEVMNTAAACRTFSVLTAEGRDVIAALIL